MNTYFPVIVFLFVIAPIIIIYLESKYSLAKKIGAVLICYGLGVFIGNIGILPNASEAYYKLLEGEVFIPLKQMQEYLASGMVSEADVSRNTVSFLQNFFSTIPIILCLPLILFSLDVKKWAKHAKTALGSLLLGIAAVLIMIFLGFYLFAENITEGWKVGGLLVAVYTGGTPNMAAIKLSLDVSQEVYILTHTYEMTLGAIYLIFIFSIGQRTFLWLLPPYKKGNNGSIDTTAELADLESYQGFWKKEIFWPLLGALVLSGAILGVSKLLSKLFPGEFADAATVIFVTSFGIALSFVPRIRQIKKTFQLGMYFILIFCVAVASMADVSKLANISISLFYFVGVVMFGSLIVHAILARIFKIDADTVLISGTALICSPPFVPVVASAIKNREVILTGMLVGIAGYAVGNYLGVIVAYILK